MNVSLRKVLWLTALFCVTLGSNSFAVIKKRTTRHSHKRAVRRKTTRRRTVKMPPPGKPVPAAIPKAPVKPIAVPQPGEVPIGPPGSFGQLYELNSGWSYQVLSAKISYDAFDDSANLFAAAGQKLLVLDIAIKNTSSNEQTFNYADHQFQVQDTQNRLYGGGNYRLAAQRNAVFSPTLEPGESLGDDANNPLEVAIPIGEDAKVANINLLQGRKGSKEELVRFPVVGVPGADAKNTVAAAQGEDPRTIMKPGDWVPSAVFQMRVDSVDFTAGPFKGAGAPGHRRFAVVKLTVKNVTSKLAAIGDLLDGAFDQVSFGDAEGKKYPASMDLGVLKAGRDMAEDRDFLPGEERAVRVVCLVPVDGDLQTLSVGAKGGKCWVFDATGWG